MKKRLRWVPAVLALCLTACQPAGNSTETGLVAEENKTNGSEQDSADGTGIREQADGTQGSGVQSGGGQSGAGLSGEEQPGEGIYQESEDNSLPEDNVSRPLTGEELEALQAYFNQSDNYGFLLSGYMKPEDINLNELLYSGAGIKQAPLTDEERAAYLKALNRTEIDTDIIRLTTEQIDSFLLKKAGIALKDVSEGLGWTYLPEYDAYYNEHGDTNIRSFFCVKGEKKGSEYKIWCLSDGYSQLNMESMVTLKKMGDSYQYRSNEITWDDMGFYGTNGGEPSIEALRFIVKSYKNDIQNKPEDFSGFIFDSDRRYYTKGEIEELSWKPKLLSVLRNEIYARHGYHFNSEYWNEFFGAYTWYDGQFPADKFDTGFFNEYEKANLKLVTQLER